MASAEDFVVVKISTERGDIALVSMYRTSFQ